jgi:uncharacterized RDD family membrane protein YckC
METVEINTAFNVGLNFEYAIFHKRALAYAIDLATLIIYLFFMKFFLYTGLNLNTENNQGLDIVLISIPMLLYSLISEVLMNGQTIGKKILKIRVISLEGGEPTLGQFILRWITKFFEWPFLFGYIAVSYENIVSYVFITCLCAIPVIVLVLATRKKQRLGDLAAGTTVVETKTELSLNDTIFINVANENYKPTFPEVMKLSDNDINTINTILSQTRKSMNYELCQRVEYKVKDVLEIKTNLYGVAFLKKLMEDYNYLATREN